MRQIPFFHQRTDYYCGPAIIQMVLGAYGIRITQREAARLAKTDKESGRATGKETGTSTKNLLKTLRDFGLRTEAHNGRTIKELKGALKTDLIVIVCYTESKEEWGHYAIVKGFRTRTIMFIDPDAHTAHTPMKLREFKKRWQDPLHTKSKQWAAFIDGPAKKSKKGS
jgi:ABC-type bacteriocin/lantibiotic exporter with double-glycine peptidase domain